MVECNIAIYLRLSNDDGDKAESNSIASQRDLIKSYITTNLKDNYEIFDEYIDDGYTGTNFNRPDFRRMLNDIDLGKINCIVVKDLSRFGRDYICAGEYLEKIFPTKGIRFISINDGYDSFKATSNDDFILPFKNIFNAQYSKDISRKVKSSFKVLQSQGKFVGAFASYGYIKDPNDKHKLIIDEAAAKVVRRIFQLYNIGVGKQSIARLLNAENIPCPTVYKKLNGENYVNSNKYKGTSYWTYATINRILKNQMYIGDMVQNRSVRQTIHGKAKKNEENNWIIKIGTHEPIINKDVWNITQELLKRNTRQLDFHSNVGLFAGYVFCGNCGRAMTKVIRGKSTYYICGTFKRYGKELCKQTPIKVETLEKIILDRLNEEIKKIDNIVLPYTDKKFNNDIDLSKYTLALKKVQKLKKNLYEDYKEGILTKEEYIDYKNNYAKEEEQLLGQIEFLKSDSQKIKQERNIWIDTLLKYKHIESLDREILAEILDRIIVTEKAEEIKVEVRFKFALTE